MATMHFISGLPRSGSTLLSALLRQNPRFQAGMSGPLAGLFGALLGQMSARNEYSVFDVLLAEDLTGTGHERQMVGDDPWWRAYVIFPPGVDTQFVPDLT